MDHTAIRQDVQVFRIDGSLVELVVSEEIKDAMERIGCLGAEFIEVQMSATNPRG